MAKRQIYMLIVWVELIRACLAPDEVASANG